MSLTVRLLVVASLVCPTAGSAQSLPPVPVAHHLADSLARDFVARGGAPSVSIAVLRGADTIAIAAYGIANLEHDLPATPQSVYRLGSITKQYTAAAVMQLVDAGKVALDDSIAMHIDRLPEAWRGVTVRQLLNHTSGIPSYTALGPDWQKRWAEEMLPRTIIGMVAEKPMDFAPGSNWDYNNTGYILLGMLIEEVSGASWGADLDARFVKPLALGSTINCLNDPIIPHRVPGYEPQGEGWRNADRLAMTQPYAAGSICATAGEVARWNRLLHTGAVVSDSAYQMMITPVGAADTAPMRYGFGLAPDTLAGQQVITHGGGIHGFISSNVWVPSAELSVTVLANSGSARTEPLMRQLVRAALGVPLERAPSVVPLAAADRAMYLGVYALEIPGGPRDFTIAAAPDGGITGQMVGQGANPMLHYGNHTFGVSFDPSVRVRFTIVDGQATEMTLSQGGRVTVGKRKP